MSTQELDDNPTTIAADPTLARSLVVNPHLQVIRCSNDEIVVKHGTRSLFSEVIADEARSGLLGRVIDRLRIPGSVDDLIAEGILTTDDLALAVEAIEHLRQRNVLVPAQQTPARAYANTFLGAESSLDLAHFGLVGGGFLAERVAASIAPLRPGHVTVLDDRGTLEALPFDDPDVRHGSATDEASLRAVFDVATFVVVALDRWSPAALHAANAAALATKTPWMSAFFDGSEAVVGPTYVPGETCCYFEFESQHEASLTLKGEYVLYKEALLDSPPYGPSLTLPSHADVAGGFAATSALQFMLSGSSFTIGRAVRVNFETASIDYQDVLRLPRCPACQGLRPPYRHLFL